jgi:hypothetical protein
MDSENRAVQNSECKFEKMVKSIVKALIPVLFGLVLIATNPGQDDVKRRLKSEEGIISMVFVEERTNYVFFSIYRVNISSLKQGFLEDKCCIGVLGQIITVE